MCCGFVVVRDVVVGFLVATFSNKTVLTFQYYIFTINLFNRAYYQSLPSLVSRAFYCRTNFNIK